MKKLLLAPAMLFALTSAKAQLALENFNAAGMPAGWSMISDANVLSSTISPSWIIPKLNAAAWTKFAVATGDSAMITTSYFTPAGTADRWLITPSFNVTSPLMAITWWDDELSSSGSSPLEVWVTTATGTLTASSFTTGGTKLLSWNCAPGGFGTRGSSLAAFNGQTVRVAFRSVGNAKGFPGVDNVQTQVLPASELALLSITPTTGSYQSYGSTTGTIPVAGVVKNNAANPVTSFQVNYQVGTGAVVSQTITPSSPISALSSASFSFTTPITPTMTNQAVKVWVVMTGDAVHTNDTLSTNVAGYTTKPTKKLMFEEGTGTWCGWCVRGIVYMDSIHNAYPNNLSIAAVHNSTSDAMTVSAYDAYMGTMISGYPSVVMDRSQVYDPSQAFTAYSANNGNYGLANIVVTPTWSGTTLTVKADVTPTASTNADYRLVLVLTENRVHGTAAGYNQTDYYSVPTYGTSAGAGPMQNKEYDFTTLSSPIPAATMYYDFVARGIYPSATGDTLSVPAQMTSGTTYSYTFAPITVNPTVWNKNNMKAIVMLVNAADETVLNSQNISIVPNSINEVAVGVNNLEVYPNPSSDVTTASFNLTEQSDVTVEVVDLLGKTVKTIARKNMTAGECRVPMNVAELAAGVYMIKVSTGKGSLTQRLSVVK